MAKRRHHVVWRHYLAEWESEGEIACLRAGRIILANAKVLAVEKGFYRLRDLSVIDVDRIRGVITQMPPHVQEAQRTLLRLFAAPFQLRDEYEASGRQNHDFARRLRELMSDLEEELHCLAETDALPFLTALRAGDVTVLDAPDAFSRFMHFLALQHMRTRDRRDRVIKAAEASGLNMEATWPVLRHVVAISMASGIAARREQFQTVLLEASETAEFLTSSSPSINTFAVDNESSAPEGFELYYPVSPRFALLLGEKLGAGRAERRLLPGEEVRRYNDLLAADRPRELFARREAELARYI